MKQARANAVKDSNLFVNGKYSIDMPLNVIDIECRITPPKRT
jgi:hypothetical protein